MLRMSDLEAAYLATTYRVLLPDGQCDLRPGVRLAKFGNWLANSGAVTFAVVTAHNPASRRIAPAANERLQSALRAELAAAGWVFFPAENRPDDVHWPVEESCCVIDISLSSACKLAAKYGQKAIVFGGPDGLPLLHWIKTGQ